MKILVVTAMYPTAENPAFGSFIRTQVESLRQAGVQVDVLVLSGRVRKLIYVRGMWQLRRAIAATKPDIVHAHYGYVGFVARTQFKVPVVVTYHGDDVLGRRTDRGTITAFTHFTSLACRRLGTQVDAVIVQSREMASRFRRADVHVIPHEVDLDTFRPLDKQAARVALGLEPHRRYLLFAANPNVAVKRFPLARAAAAELLACGQDVELLVVHKVPQSRLCLYMNAADALVFSSFQEGSPNIVKQAMACNLPIIATDVGDVRELIGGTRGCQICEPNAGAFAAALAEILRAPFRTNGRDAVQHLASPVVANRLIRLYEQVVGRRTSHSYALGEAS